MKLMKTTLRKLWRLTRTTSTIVGLAVMVGLVAGVASLAVAQKSPSGGTTSSPLLKGVENVAATTTTLINSGRGAAMSMHVQPGNAPLTVNDDAGTATNLSADEVDGKDTTEEFVSATNGKAPDSDLLDGKDSTEFLGTTAKAADSDKLDGKDSTEFAAASIGTVYTDRAVQGSMGNDEIPLLFEHVPAGSYAINAKGNLVNADDDDEARVVCQLYAGDIAVDDNTFSMILAEKEPAGSPGDRSQFSLQAVVPNFGGGTVSVKCGEHGDSDRVLFQDTVLTAIRVGTVE
jgi:hypothetical protein